jgi:DNA replication protein DnaC
MRSLSELLEGGPSHDEDRSDAHLLFKVVSARYERSSTIITSNKSIREWPEMLVGDEVLTTAILDRLLHHCHVVHVDGSSYRLWEMEQRTRPKQRKEE